MRSAVVRSKRSETSQPNAFQLFCKTSQSSRQESGRCGCMCAGRDSPSPSAASLQVHCGGLQRGQPRPEDPTGLH
jgi:hypothetical protein